MADGRDTRAAGGAVALTPFRRPQARARSRWTERIEAVLTGMAESQHVSVSNHVVVGGECEGHQFTAVPAFAEKLKRSVLFRVETAGNLGNSLIYVPKERPLPLVRGR
jgi:hypothetical protein